MQAREDCAEWYCKKFLGSKWRMKLFEEFYTNGGKGSPIRLAHLRASLDEACLGTNAWVARSLDSDVDFKKEVLDKEGIRDYSLKWRERLEAEMAEIAQRLAACASRDKPRRVSFSDQGAQPRRVSADILAPKSCEPEARTSSQVSEMGTRPSSVEDSASPDSLPDAFERLKTAA